MLGYLGWSEAAGRIQKALETTMLARQVTKDLALQIDDAVELSTNEFAKAVLKNM